MATSVALSDVRDVPDVPDKPHHPLDFHFPKRTFGEKKQQCIEVFGLLCFLSGLFNIHRVQGM